MFYRLSRAMKNQKGFTLVELMVVVVIIGILVAVAVPVYNSVTIGAGQKAVSANLRTIDGAIMQHTTNSTVAPTSGAAGNLTGNYLQTWPSGPEDVVYGITGDGSAATPYKATATSAGGKLGMTAATAYTLSTVPW